MGGIWGRALGRAVGAKIGGLSYLMFYRVSGYDEMGRLWIVCILVK